MPLSEPSIRLHIGCGSTHLAGWVNIDAQPLPGVDVVADVTKGLDFEHVEAVYAEHFLEHLTIDAALSFLCEVHRVLAPTGWLRLSTPNLDWVWATHYRLDGDSEMARAGAFHANRAFHGWGHQFLWNRTLLEDALLACGFQSLHFRRYGESSLPIFQKIEHHEQSVDTPELPSVIIVEAQRGAAAPDRLTALRDRIRRDLHT